MPGRMPAEYLPDVPPPPRRVDSGYFLRKRWFFVVTGIGELLVALAALGILSHYTGELPPGNEFYFLYMQPELSTASAVIYEIKQIKDYDVRGKHPWRVKASFRPEGYAEPLSFNSYSFDIDKNTYYPGQKVEIEYVTGSPSIARIPGLMASVVPPWMWFLVGAFLLAGAGNLIFLVYIPAKLESRFYRDALAAEAEVVDITPVPDTIPRGTPMKITYRFRSSMGIDIESVTKSRDRDWAIGMSPGSRIMVIYSETQPNRNVMWDNATKEICLL